MNLRVHKFASARQTNRIQSREAGCGGGIRAERSG